MGIAQYDPVADDMLPSFQDEGKNLSHDSASIINSNGVHRRVCAGSKWVETYAWIYRMPVKNVKNYAPDLDNLPQRHPHEDHRQVSDDHDCCTCFE